MHCDFELSFSKVEHTSNVCIDWAVIDTTPKIIETASQSKTFTEFDMIKLTGVKTETLLHRLKI